MVPFIMTSTYSYNIYAIHCDYVYTSQSQFVFFQWNVGFIVQNELPVNGPIGDHGLQSDQLEDIVRPVQYLFSTNSKIFTLRSSVYLYPTERHTYRLKFKSYQRSDQFEPIGDLFTNQIW
jgi:hypothetical protein